MATFQELHPATTDTTCGTVLLTHGLGEYSRRYLPLIAVLNKAGFAVVRYDLYGHGESSGERHRANIDRLVAENLAVRQVAVDHADELGVPFFQLGHSLGALITALAVTQRPEGVTAVTLVGFAVGIRDLHFDAQAPLLRRLSRIAPGLPVGRVLPEQISLNPEVVAAAKVDPDAILGWQSATTGAALSTGAITARRSASRWPCDALVLQGGCDALVDPRKVERWVGTAGSSLPKAFRPKVEYHLYPDSGHELLNEDVAADAHTQIIRFFAARCPQ